MNDILLQALRGQDNSSSSQPIRSETPHKYKGLWDISTEIIRGDWGNGSERQTKLQNAGYNYHQVQDFVNKRLKGTLTDNDYNRSYTDEAMDVSVDTNRIGQVEQIAGDIVKGKYSPNGDQTTKFDFNADPLGNGGPTHHINTYNSNPESITDTKIPKAEQTQALGNLINAFLKAYRSVPTLPSLGSGPSNR